MSAINRPVQLDLEAVQAFCNRNRIRRLALFGSILRDDFGADSDVDMLVEFFPDARVGWNIVLLADELEDLIGHPVDLRTPMELSRHFRQQVLAEARVIYESAEPERSGT